MTVAIFAATFTWWFSFRDGLTAQPQGACVEAASQSTRADLTGMERGESMKRIFVWTYTLAPLSSAEWETWLNAVDDYDAGFHGKGRGKLKK